MTEALSIWWLSLARLEEQGLLLHPRTLEGRQLARARYDGREVINLASNNYLGLAAHPRMNEARRGRRRNTGREPARSGRSPAR